MNRKNRTKRVSLILLNFALTLTLGACVRSLSEGTGGGENFPFRAPTLVPTSSPEPTSTASLASVLSADSTPSATCVDVLSFMNDLTVPDGTEVSPGSSIDKRWEVRNNGTCNWDERYHLRLLAGSEMGAETEQALFPARSGSSAVIRMIFTAPTEPGNYRSAWQAYNPDNLPFGDPFYIEIVVK